MSACRVYEGCGRTALFQLVVFLSSAASAGAVRADGYLIEDGGLRGPAAYDGEGVGESVLVAPGGVGSFESLSDQSPLAGDGIIHGDALPAGSGSWFPSGCTDCGGQGCEACAGAQACGHGCGLCGPACPRWVVQVDVLMLWQSNIGSRPVLSTYDPTTMVVGRTALDVNEALAPMSAGPRVGVFYNLDKTYAIEGNYFQARPFAGQAKTGRGSFVEDNLAGNNFPIDTDTVFDSASLFTRASIQSAELNWRRRECWCPITWLAGFRWVEWDQQLHIDESAAEGTFSSLFRTDTANNLYGGQLGAELGLWTGAIFNVNGLGKAGVYYNNAGQTSKYQDNEGSFEKVTANADQTAFFGEVGLNGSVQLTSWLAWRLGYSLFWLSGVAVPADQLAVTDLNLARVPPTAQINTNGSVLLQGVTTGLEARW